jgi:hypothetical protein
MRGLSKQLPRCCCSRDKMVFVTVETKSDSSMHTLLRCQEEKTCKIRSGSAWRSARRCSMFI